MGLAAMASSRVEGPVKLFRERLCERRPKAVAMTACARKILSLVWHIWTSGKPYDNQERHSRKLKILDRGKADGSGQTRPKPVSKTCGGKNRPSNNQGE